MNKVVWPDAALDDLENIREYIDQFHPSAAREFVERLKAAGNGLKMFPSRGRMVPGEENVRELTVVYPYVIRYENLGDTITILGSRHGMRDEPEG